MTKMGKRDQAIVRAAMKLYGHADQFPVRRFTLDPKTGVVKRRYFSGDYGWMDELIHACAAKSKPRHSSGRKGKK